MLNRLNLKSTTLACLGAGMLVLASCDAEKKSAPSAMPPVAERTVNTQEGVAGGVVQDVFRISAVVAAVDVPTRKVTLTGPEGKSVSFTASPEIRNLAQLHAGDTVTATFTRRIAIIVGGPEAAQPASYTATAARAALGDKPGALVAEELEISARVRSIDAAKRTAVLEFADGTQKTVPVRPDVDLTRYNAGDTVTTRVTSALTLLATAAKP